MSPKACADLPTIDFSKLDLNNPSNNPEEWEFIRYQVKKAVEEYGCFKANSSKISSELTKAVLRDIEELFALPLETKMRNVADMHNGGYIGKATFTPLFESLGFLDPIDLEKIERITDALWPEGKPSFSKNMQSYSVQVLGMEKIMRTMILESLGLEKYLEEHINSTTTSLRIMKYDAPEPGEPQIALAPHIDQDMITILYQNEVGGLEVQSKVNGDWINVNLSPNNFLVLIGETFQAWTNGRTYAPIHRVTMSGNKDRYSVGTFTATKFGYIVKAPEEVVDEQNPLLYRPFDFMEVNQRFQQDLLSNSQKDIPTIKDYFGV
ncbi:hypothetical protein JCGZ_06223 [Jatropha curcas]|uniref:Fe2OG dioxygenase domain-containing protein n=1 Tax=Jatropha curcas TaxID=180498 RepID=A0A067KM15_JATCU|nr:probable 2-oxoglutarate-dependent dioxygenase AOP1 [Jatropha curcas]KDP37167.1 hypothetical protein JCGZ_06223 [Jatropha curcas]